MPRQALTVSHIYIKVAGADLPDDIYSSIQEVTVDQNAHLPDMFTVLIHDRVDQQTGKFPITDGNTFKLGQAVKIEAPKYDENMVPTNEKLTLFEGEITALEPAFGKSMVAELLVRGYDKSHRGYRETKSKAFLNTKDTDLAESVASANGLSPQTDRTETVYDHIYQNNQSDLAFLQQRAWRIGYESFVEEGKLHFIKPKTSGSECELSYGEDLISFRPRMTVANQVEEVVVKGWDPVKKEPILGQSKSGKLFASIGDSKKGEEYSKEFGTSKLVITDHPVVSQAEANAIAQARMNELTGSFIEAHGEAHRRPDIRAGKRIKLKELGERFSGTYLVTSATHVWAGSEGFTTHFEVNGARSGTLVDRLSLQDPVDRWPGVVPAVVTQTDDPDKWGRVKVKFPWMADDQESEWARIASVGAGPDSGLIAVHDVNDEVLVAFEHGDFNRPYILGGLWNGKDSAPSDTTGASAGEIPLVRTWRSRTGHFMSMYDNSDNKVEIVTAGGHSITLDDNNKKLEIKSNGGITLTVDDNSKKVEVQGGGDFIVQSDGNMQLSSKGKMTIESMQDMVLESKTNLNLKGTATLTAEGTSKATLKGATVEVQGSALTEIKGALVKIN